MRISCSMSRSSLIPVSSRPIAVSMPRCSNALADDEIERRQLSKALLPHVRHFYAGYFDPDTHAPYYRLSSQA